MELTDEQLKLLERLGAAFFSYKECALVLQVDAAKLKTAVTTAGTPAHTAYNRGRMMVELELREELVKSAKRGSSPAMQQLMKVIEGMKSGNV